MFSAPEYDVGITGLSWKLRWKALAVSPGWRLVLAGHDIQTAAGLNEALEICQSGKSFDMISGYDPGCDGCPYATKCPVIAKPFVHSDLIAAMNRVLENPPRALRT